jgi:hypothetical protein
MGKQLLVPLLAGHSTLRNKLMVHNDQTSLPNIIIIIIIM